MTESPSVYRFPGVTLPLSFEMEGNRWVLRIDYSTERRCWTCMLEGPTRWHICTFPRKSNPEQQLQEEGLVVDRHNFLDRVFSYLVSRGIAERGTRATTVAPALANGAKHRATNDPEREPSGGRRAFPRPYVSSHSLQMRNNVATAVRLRARGTQRAGSRAPRILLQPGAA